VAVRDKGDEYTRPARGFLYFTLPADKQEVARKEWNDLKKVAGTGQAVAFGARYTFKGKVRNDQDITKYPVPYPIGYGLEKLPRDSYQSRKLHNFPMPLSPTEGTAVEPGPVTLKVRNHAGKSEKAHVLYVFEIEDGKGQSERSSNIAEGDGVTEWTPKLKVEPGQNYTWRAWIVPPQGERPVVLAVSFRGKSKP
jgi:hypothetical protein